MHKKVTNLIKFFSIERDSYTYFIGWE